MRVMKNLLIGLRIALGAALLTLGSCGIDSGDTQSTTPIVTGVPCAASGDCASGQVCGFPTAAECTAPTKGVCLVYPTPGTAHCNSVLLACDCSGNQAGIPCDYPSGYAPTPIKSTNVVDCP